MNHHMKKGNMGENKFEKGDMNSAIKRLLLYLKNSKGVLFSGLLLAAMGAVMTIVGPNRIGEIADLMGEGITGKINLAEIFKLSGILAGIYIFGAVLTFLQHYILSGYTLNCSKRMREDLSKKINRVPQKYFSSTSYGDILSRITNDVSTLQQGLSNSLPGVVSSATQFIGCLIMMFITDFRLAICVLIVTIIGMGMIVLVIGRSQKYFIAQQKNIGNINGYIEEMYSGHMIVNISKAKNKIKDKFSALNQSVYDANWKSQFISGIMQPLMTAIGNISYVTVCVVGALLAINGNITFGVIVSFILYARLFSTPLSQIAQGITNMQTAFASANRIFDFLETEELSNEENKKSAPESVKGSVVFDHVSFSYPDAPDKIIIKDFSAAVKPGQKIAIVGPTGAGKTTLVNLLMRFFEVNSGSIMVDGVSLEEIKREDVHDMFAMVLQDTWLFEGTIRENLVYNMTDITDDEIRKVLKTCGIERFVSGLPHGLDTILSESTSVSAGQKQLLTIARAMLQKCPMLILDEATSSVDTRTEAVIQKAMDELTANRTSFVIAHRLSTIKNSDLILVMKDGDVIESGDHYALMEQGGFYSELYKSQFEKTA